MTSYTTERFRKCFRQLPPEIQGKARKVYQAWKQDPWNKTLRFKKVHPNRKIHSVRIGLDWRALGVQSGEDMIWFWIGSHSEYDKLLSKI